MSIKAPLHNWKYNVLSKINFFLNSFKKPSATHFYVFRWSGHTQEGKKTGVLIAPSLLHVKLTLIRQGVYQYYIKKRWLFSFYINLKNACSFLPVINFETITFFISHMTTLLMAGIPLLETFKVIEQGENNLYLKKLINEMIIYIENGNSLSSAFERYPKYFNHLFCHLVKMGEQTGHLQALLIKIIQYREKTAKIRRKIRKTLTYPIALLIITAVIINILLLIVVPQFENFFKSFNGTLPISTYLLILLSHELHHYEVLIIISLIAITVITKKLFKSPFHLINIQKFLLKLPWWGNLYYNSIIALISYTLSIQLAAGITLPTALAMTAQIISYKKFSEALLQIRHQIEYGSTFETALKNIQLFPDRALQMVVVGEKTGTLEKMLHKIAELYENTFEHAVEQLSNLVEPLMITILGLLIGGFIIALYLPIFNLGNIIQ